MDNRQPFQELSNTLKFRKKRLSDGTVKTYSSCQRKIRKTIDIYFDSQDKKMEFETKIQLAKKKLKCLTTEQLLSRLLESSITDRVIPEGHTPRSKNNLSNQQYFLCSKEKIFELVELCRSQQEIVQFEQIHHVGILFLRARNTSTSETTWTSSPYFEGNYHINYKLVHSYLCAGIRATQYESFCKFSSIGMTTEYFRSKMLGTYAAAVEGVKVHGVDAALDLEVASSPGGRISIITDARHACRKNSFHTDVITIGAQTNRIVHYEHVTKDDDRVSQRHEVVGCRRMYESLNARNVQVNTISTLCIM